MKFIKSPPEPGSARWRRTITASKIPIIAGLYPWKTRQQLYEEMTGEADPLPPSMSMKLGKHLESSLIDAAIDCGITPTHFMAPSVARGQDLSFKRIDLPRTVTTTGPFAGTIGADSAVPMTATVDGWGVLGQSETVVIEAKVVADRPEDWLKGVPDYVDAQVQFQLLMADKAAGGLVVALTPDLEVEIFKVERCHKTAAWLVAEALWWRELIEREVGELDD